MFDAFTLPLISVTSATQSWSLLKNPPDMVLASFKKMLSRWNSLRKTSYTLPVASSLSQAGAALRCKYNTASPTEIKAAEAMNNALRVMNSSNSQTALNGNLGSTSQFARCASVAGQRLGDVLLHGRWGERSILIQAGNFAGG